MILYEYAVYKDEKRDKDDNVIDEAEVIVAPTTILAADERQVGIRAAKAIPDEHMKNVDRIQVVVRSF